MSVRSTELSSFVDDVSSESSEESVYLTLFPPRVILSRTPVELCRQNTDKNKDLKRRGTDVWKITLNKFNDVENLIEITGIDVNAEL